MSVFTFHNQLSHLPSLPLLSFSSFSISRCVNYPVINPIHLAPPLDRQIRAFDAFLYTLLLPSRRRDILETSSFPSLLLPSRIRREEKERNKDRVRVESNYGDITGAIRLRGDAATTITINPRKWGRARVDAPLRTCLLLLLLLSCGTYRSSLTESSYSPYPM